MIYFIRCGDYIKIGFTNSKSAKKRINELQTGNPIKLKKIGAIHHSNWIIETRIEKDLHKLFQKHKKRGEWFDAEPVLNWYNSLNPKAELRDIINMPIDDELTAVQAIRRLSL